MLPVRGDTQKHTACYQLSTKQLTGRVGSMLGASLEIKTASCLHKRCCCYSSFCQDLNLLRSNHSKCLIHSSFVQPFLSHSFCDVETKFPWLWQQHGGFVFRYTVDQLLPKIRQSDLDKKKKRDKSRGREKTRMKTERGTV